MSYIDISGALEKLALLRDSVTMSADELVDREVKAMQTRAVELVHKREGNLASLLAAEDAIEKTGSLAEQGKAQWRFGFLTAASQKAGFYAFFGEFGTKGYSAGEQRSAGVDKRGRQRTQKVKRDIPARQAWPFMRPAYIGFQRAIERLGMGGILRHTGKFKVD